VDESLLDKLQTYIINSGFQCSNQGGRARQQTTQQCNNLVFLENGAPIAASFQLIPSYTSKCFSTGLPFCICVQKYCFFKNSLFARVSCSKLSFRSCHASCGPSQELKMYKWPVSVASTIAEKALCDCCANWACCCLVASSTRTAVPSTWLLRPLTNRRCLIWNFHVCQTIQTLSFTVTPLPIPASDFKPYINQYVSLEWQKLWNSFLNNKLYISHPTINSISALQSSFSRKDQTVINRLMIGHSHLTHLHLITKESPPSCCRCSCLLSIEHILCHGQDYQPIRCKYFSYTSLSDIFFQKLPKNNF